MQTATSLTEYDFIIVLDASGSMGETDMPGGKSRWDAMQETCMAFCRDISAIDSDGIGLVIFGNDKIDTFDGVGPDEMKDAFAARGPRGGTPLAQALSAAFSLAGKSDKKDFILVFTDGVPDDKNAAAQTIIAAANKQDSDDALTVLFVQVGADRSAAAYLQQLDDNLKGAKFDIVDTKTMAEANAFATTVDLVIAAIND